MAVDFLAFLAKLVIGLVLLKLLEVHTVRRDPDSAFGQALAFLVG